MSNDGSVGAALWDQERRKHRRKKCFLPAKLLTAAGSFDCQVLDISHGGAKVETGVAVTDEQAVTLVVKSIGTFAGLVAWRRNGCFGMRFLAQHGTSKMRPAALTAAVGGPEKQAGEPGPAPPPEGLPEDGVPPPPAESPFTLRRGDLVCLLRRKSGGRGTRAKVSAEVDAQALAGYRLVEIDARHFMELIGPNRAFSITLMRVTSSDARRSKPDRAARLTDAERALLLSRYS